MNKILLISPPFYRLMGSHYNGLSLGLCYIASVLKENGHEVFIYNADHLDDNVYLDQRQLLEGYDNYKKILSEIEHPIWLEVREKITEFAPHYIGIQMYTATYKSARNIAEIAKIVNQEIKVVVGGTHPTIDPVTTLQSGPYDYAVFGEGEYTFLDIVSGGNIREIAGVAYVDKAGGVRKNEERGFIQILDSVPFPVRDGFINDANTMDLGAMITSRGCPFKCTYCVSPKIWKNRVRYRSIDNVVDELEYMVNKCSVDLIRFQDDTFTLNKSRVSDVCNGILDRGLKFQWVCDTRVDRLDTELLQMMKEAGCSRIKVGVESGSNKILKRVNKGITKEKILKAVSAIKEIGIPLTIYLMIGFPGETNEDARETIQFSEQIDADYNSLSIVAPYYGTEMYKQLKRDGYPFDKNHWEYFFPSEQGHDT